jgi:Ca-activated chloride channel family protein
MDEIFYKGRKITDGTMLPVGIEDFPLPLTFTELRSSITGMVADVKVIQKFHNDLDKNIEAVYIFPLPSESAVHSLEIKINERTIKSEIKEKEEAKRVYEQAKNEMKQGALLEQERPNLFTMSVANIEPGQEIFVTLEYYETIAYEDGEYKFVFPMTVTPRYNPQSVTDRERISPTFQSPDRTREINIFIDLDAGFTIGEVTSPTHLLYIQEKDEHIREIQLAKEGEIPNKDFILKYSSDGEKVEETFTFYREEGKTGTFMFHLTPKIDYGPEEMLKREIIFVLDRSGSMEGSPMEQAKKALKACLRTLRQGDMFAIINFDDQLEVLSEPSLAFNDENLKKADDFVNATSARGWTEILLAMDCALRMPVNKEYLRQIIFLTDGAVGNEDQVIKEVEKILGKARIFTFGIGSSVNRYLLDKMAEIGRGTVNYLLENEDIEEAIQKFANQAAFPVLGDISLEWENASVTDVYPLPVPDVYFGQVLQLFGRFHSAGHTKAILKGRTGQGEFAQEFSMELPEKHDKNRAIETIWARKRIDHLLGRLREYPQETHSIRDEVIGLSMKYHLMSPYTSLVAVEKDDREREKKEIIRVDVPLMAPEGYESSVTPVPMQVPYPSFQSITMSSIPDSDGLSLDSFELCAGSGIDSVGLSFSMDKFCEECEPECMPPDAPPPPAPSTVPAPPPPKGLMKVQSISDASTKYDGLDTKNSFESDTDIAFEKAEYDMSEELCFEDVSSEEPGSVFLSDELSPSPVFEEDISYDETQCSMKECEATELSEKISVMDINERLNLTLKYLARNQTAEGSWSKDEEISKRLVSTCFGILAFINEGHTNKSGNYKPQLEKAVYFIKNNMDKLSGLSLALASNVFFELYRLSGKKKEKIDAEKILEKLKIAWNSYVSVNERIFAFLAVKSAVKAGLVKEEDFDCIDKWLVEAGEEAKKVTGIITVDDMFTGLIAEVTGKTDLYAAFLKLLLDYHIDSGEDSGSIRIQGLYAVMLDITAIGAFIISVGSER